MTGRQRSGDGAPRGATAEGDRSQILCLVPADLASRLVEPLRGHYEGADVEVIAERRSGERRSGLERRKQDLGPPRGTAERRRIRSASGRRAGERRTALEPETPPRSLPRKARPHADRLNFARRILRPAEELEDLDTARLVTRIQSGDQRSFAALYERYFDRTYAYLRVLLKDSHEAEDQAQQVFLRVLDALPDYELRRGKPFRAWLFRIARNEALGHLRRYGRLEVEEPNNLDRLREAPGERETSAHALQWISDADLTLFIERLPEAQRQALTLRFLLGLNTEEIAEILERTPQAVRKLEHRALRFLEARLAAIGRQPRRSRRTPTLVRMRRVPVLRARRFALGAAAFSRRDR